MNDILISHIICEGTFSIQCPAIALSVTMTLLGNRKTYLINYLY